MYRVLKIAECRTVVIAAHVLLPDKYVCDWRFFHWTTLYLYCHQVTTYPCLELCIHMPRIFPGLRQHAIIPINIIWIMTKLALLRVLFNRCSNLICSQFHLGGRFLWNLAQKVQQSLSSIQWNVVPSRENGVLVRCIVEDAEFKRIWTSLHPIKDAQSQQSIQINCNNQSKEKERLGAADGYDRVVAYLCLTDVGSLCRCQDIHSHGRE